MTITTAHVIRIDRTVKQSHYRPGQAQRVLRKLRFPDYMTTAQDGNGTGWW